MPNWSPHGLGQVTRPQAQQRNDRRRPDPAPEPANEESAPWTSAADPGLRPALAELDRLTSGAGPGADDA